MLSLTPYNIILFELDFDVEFPLFRLIQILSDLKSTILTLDLISHPASRNASSMGFSEDQCSGVPPFFIS